MIQSSSEQPTLAASIGREVWTVPALLDARAAATPADKALWQRSAAGEWQSTTWREYHETVARIGRGLRNLSLRPGETVGILAASSREWDFAHLGVLAAGGIVVGLDPHDTDEHLDDIAARCELSGLILQDPQAIARFTEPVQQRLRFVIGIAGSSSSGIRSLDEIVKIGKEHADEAGSAVQPDDPATIIFTSGTTGTPKGIRYSHRQVCLAAASILSVFDDIDEHSRLTCWLPLSNLFQRMINICAIARGAQTYYVDKPQDIMQHVAIIEPHVFIGVPRFYEKLYAGIRKRVDEGPSWQKRLIDWAIREGDRHATAVRAGRQLGLSQRLAYRLAECLILGRLRQVMGRNLRYLISGSAPMPLWLLERFHAMGLLILEAYGMSENIIPVAANRPGAFRFGTVGRPMPGSEIRLVQDNELVVRGPGVFSGYFGEEAKHSPVDAEGYLASGDYATVDADGFITLTGRKSEIFKTSTGRRIAPVPIEACLKQLAYVEHAVVIGRNRPLPVALLSLDLTALRSHAIASAPDSPMASETCERIGRDVAVVCAGLPERDRPAGILVTTKPFTIAGGELTGNLKLRRKPIEDKYATDLDALYAALAKKQVQRVCVVREAS